MPPWNTVCNEGFQVLRQWEVLVLMHLSPTTDAYQNTSSSIITHQSARLVVILATPQAASREMREMKPLVFAQLYELQWGALCLLNDHVASPAAHFSALTKLSEKSPVSLG